MLKKRLGKVVALLSAAVMSISSCSVAISALSTASAADDDVEGTQLDSETGEGTFEEGVALPWHICENATGSMEFDITDGVYVIYLENIGGTDNSGEGRWDCQFRHRNLYIEWDHTYRITYSVWASEEGNFYTKIGDMTNDDAEYWHMNGTVLDMDYEAGLTQDELYDELVNASTTSSYVEYYTWGGEWNSNPNEAETWITWAYEFTVSASDMSNVDTSTLTGSEGTGEWTFHLGGVSAYNTNDCYPQGTILKFDNLMLIDMTDDETDYFDEADYEATGVEVNQIGYYPNSDKVGTLVLGDEEDTTEYEFTINDAQGNTVYTGTTSGECTYDSAAWAYVQKIDFSDFTEEGEGYTITCDGKTSLEFDIAEDLYAEYYDESLLTYALNYFYQNRSGYTTEEEYIPSDQTVETDDPVSLARTDNHNPDICYIQDSWIYIYSDLPDTSNGSIDATGGWNDAGDYGKYVVNGGISLWTLMNMYERSAAYDDTSKWDDGSGTLVLPDDETSDGLPDILNECQYELDFFLEMQRDDGMVYHKVHDYKWTALAVAPFASSVSNTGSSYADGEDEDNIIRDDSSTTPMRIAKPVTLAATLNLAAACAQAARLFEDYDSDYADTLLEAAELSWDAAIENYVTFDEGGWGSDWSADTANDGEYGGVYAPISYADKGGGGYGDDNVSDEYYWAACELYITTGDSTYYDYLTAYGDEDAYEIYTDSTASAFDIVSQCYGGENEGTFSFATWGTVTSLGSISLLVNADELLDEGLLTEDEVQTLEDNLLACADTYVDQTDESGFGTPYQGLTYDAEVWSYDNDTDTATTETISLVDGYEWGSNSMVINNAIVMALAYDLTYDENADDNTDAYVYGNGVISAMDYLLGNNLIEQSYITGYGEHSTTYPHHRWWSGALDSTNFPYAPYGVLSGGNNSNMNDPMIQGMGYSIGELAPMACYLDNLEAWSVNECTINWNAPLCWIASWLDDEGNNIYTTSDVEGDTDTDEGDEEEDYIGDDDQGLLGDTNLDGEISLVDVVLLNRNLDGTEDFSDLQTHNADVDESDTVTSTDMSILLQFMLGLVDSLPYSE